MKQKTLLVLFTLLATLIGTSCSSDKDSDPNNSYTFKDGNFTYNGQQASADVAFSIAFESNETATITLQNGVTGSPDLRIIGVPMKSTKDGYTFEAVDKNADREITINGTLSKEELVASSDVKYKTSSLGKWELKKGDRTGSDTPEAYFLFEVEPSTEEGKQFEFMYKLLPSIVGQLLHNAVDIVTLDFKENGELKIYYKVPAGSESALPEMEIPLEYFVKDGKINIAIHKTLIDEMLPGLIPANLNLNLDDVKALFEKTGNHYALTLNNKLEGDYNEFYIDETLMSKIVPIVIDLIPEDGIPLGEDNQLDKEWLSSFIGHIGDAKSVKLGLGFDKVTK